MSRKIIRVLGKRGRITIPYEIRVRNKIGYNDILSFEEQDEVRNMFFKVILVFGLVEIPNVYTNLIRMCRVWILFADGC